MSIGAFWLNARLGYQTTTHIIYSYKLTTPCVFQIGLLSLIRRHHCWDRCFCWFRRIRRCRQTNLFMKSETKPGFSMFFKLIRAFHSPDVGLFVILGAHPCSLGFIKLRWTSLSTKRVGLTSWKNDKDAIWVCSNRVSYYEKYNENNLLSKSILFVKNCIIL